MFHVPSVWMSRLLVLSLKKDSTSLFSVAISTSLLCRWPQFSSRWYIVFLDFLFSICLLVVFSCSRLAFEYTWDCETGYSARSGLMTARDAKMSHDTGKQWACICMNPSGVGFWEWHILTATKSSCVNITIILLSISWVWSWFVDQSRGRRAL